MNDKTVMLVEDNPDDEELTLRALKKNNIKNGIVVMRDGKEALDYLFSTADLPVVVLLDLKLPKINGLEVLRQLRGDARTRLLPVVILTTSNEQKDIVDGYKLNANSFIRKPVNFDEFNEAVRQLGVYWLSLNEPPPKIQ